MHNEIVQHFVWDIITINLYGLIDCVCPYLSFNKQTGLL